MAAVVSLAAGVPLIRLSHVSKHYGTGEGIVHAMRDVDLTIQQGEFVAIIGASGSGKSTMMNVLGCLDRPSRGSYELAGIDVADKHGDARAVVAQSCRRLRLSGIQSATANDSPRKRGASIAISRGRRA